MIKRLKIWMAMLLILPCLAFGAVTMSSAPASASITISPSTCSNCPGGSPECVTFGFSSISTQAIQRAFEQVLQEFLDSFTNFFRDIFNNFLGGLLNGLNDVFEQRFINWQDNFIAYDLIPNMQRQTNQVYTEMVSSSQAVNSGIDGQVQATALRNLNNIEADSFLAHQPAPGLCVAGAGAGSNMAQAYSFGRLVRGAWETKFSKRGMGSDSQFTIASLNLPPEENQTLAENGTAKSRMSPGLEGLEGTAFEGYIQNAQLSNSWKTGPIGHLGFQWERYCALLADPRDNGGNNGCRSSGNAETRGMDVNPTKYLFNQTVINMNDPDVKNAMEAMIENLTSTNPPNIVRESDSNFRQGLIDQRSYLARQNAARAVVNYIVSRRTPVQGGANELVKELRESAGTPLKKINPDYTSYKEIMHAMSTEKFASGKYNVDKIGDVKNAKREAVVLSAFYLMQLHDYYEMLERGLLALAVQTSIEVGAEATSDFGPDSTSVTGTEGGGE